MRRYEQLTSGSELVESMIKDVLPELLNAEVRGSTATRHLLAAFRLRRRHSGAALTRAVVGGLALPSPAPQLSVHKISHRNADHAAHSHGRGAGGGLAALHLLLRASQGRAHRLICVIAITGVA